MPPSILAVSTTTHVLVRSHHLCLLGFLCLVSPSWHDSLVRISHFASRSDQLTNIPGFPVSPDTPFSCHFCVPEARPSSWRVTVVTQSDNLLASFFRPRRRLSKRSALNTEPGLALSWYAPRGVHTLVYPAFSITGREDVDGLLELRQATEGHIKCMSLTDSRCLRSAR